MKKKKKQKKQKQKQTRIELNIPRSIDAKKIKIAPRNSDVHSVQRFCEVFITEDKFNKTAWVSGAK